MADQMCKIFLAKKPDKDRLLPAANGRALSSFGQSVNYIFVYKYL